MCALERERDRQTERDRQRERESGRGGVVQKDSKIPDKREDFEFCSIRFSLLWLRARFGGTNARSFFCLCGTPLPPQY